VSASNEQQIVLGSYDSYADAERAVDALADRGFPVDHVSIAARDVVVVEQVVGRMTAVKAALYGASVGGLLGLTVGILFGFLDWLEPITSAFNLGLWGLGLGVGLGALVGLVDHWAHHGTRDFESVSRLEAGSYDVVTDATYAEQASRILRDTVGSGRR
jgi:hypothetical protein